MTLKPPATASGPLSERSWGLSRSFAGRRMLVPGPSMTSNGQRSAEMKTAGAC